MIMATASNRRIGIKRLSRIGEVLSCNWGSLYVKNNGKKEILQPSIVVEKKGINQMNSRSFGQKRLTAQVVFVAIDGQRKKEAIATGRRLRQKHPPRPMEPMYKTSTISLLFVD
jgi:hypothetical protein